jgi:hypothetical protein
MKRKKRKYARERYSYKLIKPWFCWYECQYCGDEFKKEELHKFSMTWTRKLHDGSFGAVLQLNGSEYSEWFLCTSCCQTEVEARDYFQRKILPYYK